MLTDLLDLLDRWQPRPVLVAGDFMLDRYSFGHVDRLAPDAPVPVLDVQSTDDRPGGAANVCRDLVALRCPAFALGRVGQDPNGQALTQAMQDAGIDTAGLLPTPTATTVKHNLVGLAQHRHPQKMFRLDLEDRTPLSDEYTQQLLDDADQLLKEQGFAAICLEDYAKGVCTEAFCQGLIQLGQRHGIPVLVDPAAIADYTKYRGATAVTPNRTEARLATARKPANPHADLDEAADMARQLQQQHDFQYVVLTLDKSGSLLQTPEGQQHHLPTKARAVYDVTGAGDMVLAALAAAIAQADHANAANWPTATALANLAAGLEVEKPGVVPIPFDELLLEVLALHHDQLGKLRTLDQLLPELSAHRAAGKSIAFTNGCFDILHAGHVAYLRKAASHADLLVVGLNSDHSIRQIKADKAGPPRPINHQDDRVLVLSELESVDYVVLFDDDTPLSLLQAIQPDALIKGSDYTREQVVGHELVEARGGQVILVDLVEGRSTTNILRQLHSSD